MPHPAPQGHVGPAGGVLGAASDRPPWGAGPGSATSGPGPFAVWTLVLLTPCPSPSPHPTPPWGFTEFGFNRPHSALSGLGLPSPPRASPPLSTATLPAGPRLHPPPLRVWRKMANKHRPGTNSASPRGTRGAPVAGAEGGGAQRGGSAPPAGERESAELAQTLNPCLFRLWLFLKGQDWGQDRDGDPAGRGDPPGGGCGEWGVLGQGLGEAGGQRWWVAGVPVGC